MLLKLVCVYCVLDLLPCMLSLAAMHLLVHSNIYMKKFLASFWLFHSHVCELQTSIGERKLIASLWWQAKPILHGGKTKELVDPCLSNEYDSDQLERMILAASLCIRTAARSRPKMSLVRSHWCSYLMFTSFAFDLCRQFKFKFV